MARQKGGDRALGPYEYPTKYVVAIKSPDAAQRNVTFPFTGEASKAKAYAEAHAMVSEFNQAAALTAGMTIADAIAAYLRDSGIGKGTQVTERIRLANFFFDQTGPVGDLTDKDCLDLYEEMRARPDKRGNTPKGDTVWGTVCVAKKFLRFAVGKKWIRANPLDGFKPQVELNPGGKGMNQLSFTNQKKWDRTAYEMAEEGDVGAAAALLCLKTALRAEKVVTRKVDDVDLDGALIWVRDKQTRTKKHREKIVIHDERLWPIVASLAKGQPAGAWLFPGERLRVTGHRRREWLNEQVKRVCREANVPEITAHGLKGTAASLDMLDGRDMDAIQRRQAHAPGSDVTQRSYLTPEVIQRARQLKLMKLVGG